MEENRKKLKFLRVENQKKLGKVNDIKLKLLEKKTK